MAKCGFGETTDDIRRTAQAIIGLRKPSDGGDGNTNMPSIAWVYRLFERHPQLTLRSTMSLGKERATVTPQAISRWFQDLREKIMAMDPSLLDDGSRIYNADESGFAFDVKGRKVAAFKGCKHVYHISSNTKTQVTVLACMNATGHYLPPLMVYPYKRLPQKDLASGFPEAIVQASDNGWMTAAIFYTWLQDSFIPLTSHVRKPLLLLVDGHTSHTSLVETSTICQENGIILYCFVAHASHLIQPLDQAFFGSIKPAWAQATRHHIANCGNAVNLESFASVLKPVWDKSATPEIAAQSFKAAGIVPFNPERVLESEKLAPCAVFRTIQAPSLPDESATQPIITPTYLPEEQTSVIPYVVSPPQEPASRAIPSATFPQEESAPPGLPSAMFPQGEQAPPAIPSATFPQEESAPPGLPYAMSQQEEPAPQASSPSLQEETLSQAVSSAIFLPEEPAPPVPPSAISIPDNDKTSTPSCSDASVYTVVDPITPSTSNSASTSNPNSTLPNLNVQQLEAIKEFGIFLYDDLLRKQFIRFFSVLTGTETAPSDESFETLQKHIVKIIDAFKPANSTTSTEKTPAKTPLTLDDILKLPKFDSTKKKGKKLTPTIPHCISSEDFRGAMKRKLENKEKEEKEKLAKKTLREENKRKKDEEKEMMKRKKELEKLAKQQKKAEEEERKKQKRELMKQRKEQAKANRARTESSSSGEDRELREMETQMIMEMARSDDEELISEVARSDLCKGCHQKGDEELWLQCELCDGWWHRRCTKTAYALTPEEIEHFQFWCSECIPDQ